jgi:CDP-diglyceride synthetase
MGSTVEGALAGAATGAVVGAAQWLVLSRRLPLSPWWVAATSVGAAVGMAFGS